jgi:hypothetical protein
MLLSQASALLQPVQRRRLQLVLRLAGVAR